jgi:hypothetical protein
VKKTDGDVRDFVANDFAKDGFGFAQEGGVELDLTGSGMAAAEGSSEAGANADLGLCGESGQAPEGAPI